MLMFVVIGVIGALLLVSTLLFDDVIDDMIPGLDFLSGPVVGAFLAAFGLFGWFLDDGIESPIAIAVAAAVDHRLARRQLGPRRHPDPRRRDRRSARDARRCRQQVHRHRRR
jgi:hypothetical protein